MFKKSTGSVLREIANERDNRFLSGLGLGKPKKSVSEKVDWQIIEEAARKAGNVDLNDHEWLAREIKTARNYKQVLDLLEAENFHRMYGALTQLI